VYRSKKTTDPEDDDPLLNDTANNNNNNTNENGANESKQKEAETQQEIPANLALELLALPGMKEALLRRAGIALIEKKQEDDSALNDPSLGELVQMAPDHYLQELEINDYPREARWKVTQRETSSRLQDKFRTAVTLKGSYFGPGRRYT
jgi:ATP-dependent RNA helicase DDX46/PRP5